MGGGGVRILDVGSFCVEGHQSYRQFFNDDRFEYVGLDMASGPNVDIAVKIPYKWEEVPNEFCDVLISGQVFEHIEFPWLTMEEIARVLKPDGLACIVAPNGFGRHRYPVDCWRFFEDGFIALARWVGLEVLHVSVNLAPEGAPATWYSNDCADGIAVLKKPQNWSGRQLDISKYTCVPADLDELTKPFISFERQPYGKPVGKVRKIGRKIVREVKSLKKLWQ